MFRDLPPLAALVLAILDYLFKAAVDYRNTDVGRAEWLDIEAAFEDVTGDSVGAENARAEASSQRVINTAFGRSGGRVNPANQPEKIRPLTED